MGCCDSQQEEKKKDTGLEPEDPNAAIQPAIGMTCRADGKKCDCSGIPVNAQQGPIQVDLTDIPKVICQCGQSKNFPFCDGSHVAYNEANNLNIAPIEISKETVGQDTAWICACGHSKNSDGPYCDGTHKTLFDRSDIGASDKKNDNLSAAETKDGKAPSAHSDKMRDLIACSVVQAKNVKKVDATSQSDPYVVVKVGGQSQRTKRISNNANPIWNHRMKFVFKHDAPRDDQLQLELWDANTINDDLLIGTGVITARFDLNGSPLTYWVAMKDKNGQVVGQCKFVVAAGQVPLFDSRHASSLNYTDLLMLKLVGAQIKESQDLSGHADAYCKASWGNVSFQTKAVAASLNPIWNARTAFWVDRTKESGYQLLFQVFDSDHATADDSVGSAYVKMGHLFDLVQERSNSDSGLDEKKESKSSSVSTIYVPFANIALATKDKNLDDIKSAKPLSEEEYKAALVDGNDESTGYLQLKISVSSKETVEAAFWEKLLADFDKDGNGDVDMHEVKWLFSSLNIDMKEEKIAEWFKTTDKDDSGAITVDEVKTLINTLESLEPKTSARIHDYYVRSITSSLSNNDMLMEGVTHGRSEDNISVMDRETGLIVEENIPTYISVALKTMFSSAVGRSLSTLGSSEAIMLSQSIKRGEKYDDPSSAEEIRGFIDLHNLNEAEIAKPASEYKTFNQFFYRELKPEARPIANPDNPHVAVSVADCRMMVFQHISDSTKLWIKGDQFTVSNLLGPRSELTPRYIDGSLCIARLSPQDYHRWHIPVDGVMNRNTLIKGALYTVNPLAINKNVNVYTRNKREIYEIDSPQFGKVLLIAVGATMVGSINPCFVRGQCHKGQMHGYFSFGGSTVLVLFESGTIKFDEDLISNSKKGLETLVKVNTRIGAAKRNGDINLSGINPITSEEKESKQHTDEKASTTATATAAATATEDNEAFESEPVDADAAAKLNTSLEGDVPGLASDE